MSKPRSTEAGVQDTSQDVIQAIEQVDLKTLSYIQLRRLYATVMQAVDSMSEELTVRAEDDNGNRDAPPENNHVDFVGLRAELGHALWHVQSPVGKGIAGQEQCEPTRAQFLNH